MSPRRNAVWRAFLETGFIIFLFDSDLLMGEYERSGMGRKMGIDWALAEVFTAGNFAIAVVAALAGYVVVEFLGNRL